MKATLSKNNKFISITPKPTKLIRNGLKVYLWRDINESEATDLPIIMTDIIEGKMRYYLPVLDFNYKVRSIGRIKIK